MTEHAARLPDPDAFPDPEGMPEPDAATTVQLPVSEQAPPPGVAAAPPGVAAAPPGVAAPPAVGAAFDPSGAGTAFDPPAAEGPLDPTAEMIALEPAAGGTHETAAGGARTPSAADGGLAPGAAGPPAGPGTGHPQPAPQRERRDLGRWLRRFAGIDEELLAWVPQERARYTGMGGAVLFTAIMAFLSMTVALGLSFGTRSPAILIPALIWFVLILNFDRWLVSAPMSKDVWPKLPSFAVRMGMAVLFGIVIAEPLVLSVFNTAVHAQVLQSRADDLRAYQAQWERCNPIDLTAPTVTPPSPGGAAPTPSGAPSPNAVANSSRCADFVVPLPENVRALRSDFDAKQAQLAGLQATLKPLNEQHEKLVRKSQDECLGKPGVGQTGLYGDGPVCKRLTRDAENYAKLNRIDDLEKNVVTLTNDLQNLSTQIREASTQWAAQRSAYITARVDERAASTGKIGLLERIEALNTLARTHTALGGAIWAVRGLFILIDLAPALLKYTSGQTRYDRLVESNLTLGEVRFNATMQAEMARARLWAADAEGDLDLERARAAGGRAVAYDKIMDDLERRWVNSAEAAALGRPVRAGAPSGRGWPEATSRYTYDSSAADRDDY